MLHAYAVDSQQRLRHIHLTTRKTVVHKRRKK